MTTLENEVIGTQKTICHGFVNTLSFCLQTADWVPHPNVVLFDVRMGLHRRVKLGGSPDTTIE